MNFCIEGCTVITSPDVNREYYKKHTDDMYCDCSGCRNYRAYLPKLPQIVAGFFKAFGIDDMQQAADIIALCTLENGFVHYTGFYHITGRLENAAAHTWETPCYTTIKKDDGSYSLLKTGSRKFFEKRTPVKELSKGFEISISENASLVSDDMPRPVLQIDFTADIPWVLEEENDI